MTKYEHTNTPHCPMCQSPMHSSFPTRLGGQFAPIVRGVPQRSCSIVPLGGTSLMSIRNRERIKTRASTPTVYESGGGYNTGLSHRDKLALSRFTERAFAGRIDEQQNDNSDDEQGDDGNGDPLPVIVGTPLKYDTVCDAGFGPEVYQRGCFADSLATDDIAVTHEWRDDRIIGRRKLGTTQTAMVYSTQTALVFECQPPQCSWSRDLLVSINRGDINQSAARFQVIRSHVEAYKNERVNVITKAQLVRLAVCAWGASESSVMLACQTASDSGAAGKLSPGTAWPITDIDRRYMQAMSARNSHTQGGK